MVESYATAPQSEDGPSDTVSWSHRVYIQVPRSAVHESCDERKTRELGKEKAKGGKGKGKGKGNRGGDGKIVLVNTSDWWDGWIG